MYEPSHADGGHSTVIPTSTCIRIITSWKDGTEMIEEYDSSSSSSSSSKGGRLNVRKWRSSDALGRRGTWIYEIGESTNRKDEDNKSSSSSLSGLIRSSTRNPTFIAQDSDTSWIWRVRNIPYEKSVYQLSVDEEKQQIVLRTSNKKYFKRFDIPALKRLKMKLEPRAISCKYANNTLVIKHAKPPSVLAGERARRARQMEACKEKDKESGPGDCKQQ